MGNAEQPPQPVIEIEVRQGRVLAGLAGEFDLNSEADLAHRLGQAMVEHPGLEVEVDMSRVSFLDSSGIRALLQAHGMATERGCVLRLVGTHGTVREVLEIVDVYDLLTGAADE